MSIGRAAAMCATLVVASAIARADAVSDGRELERRAAQATEAGDFAAAADLLAQALVLRPNHPGVTYRFARASMRAGRDDTAIAALNSYAAMGLKADVATDPAFKPLENDARLTRIIVRFEENAKPKGSVVIAATLSESPFLAEGIAFDPKSRRLYIGSVHKRKIVVVEPNGETRDFVPSASHGLLGVFGLALHPSRGTLWAASSTLPQVGGNVAPADKNSAGVFQFSTIDGELQRKAVLPDDGNEHVIGDLLLSPSGDIFASDSIAPAIYRLGSGGSALETFVTSDRFHSLQGLALSNGERLLAVADYASGLMVINTASREVTLLPMPSHTTLHGIDGLMRHGRDLIGIQNGVDPQRVVRLRMNRTWTAVEGLDVLAANLPDMDEPTLATVAGGELLVIGNGQWRHFADDGSIKGTQPFVPTRIVRLTLPPVRH